MSRPCEAPAQSLATPQPLLTLLRRVSVNQLVPFPFTLPFRSAAYEVYDPKTQKLSGDKLDMAGQLRPAL